MKILQKSEAAGRAKKFFRNWRSREGPSDNRRARVDVPERALELGSGCEWLRFFGWLDGDCRVWASGKEVNRCKKNKQSDSFIQPKQSMLFIQMTKNEMNCSTSYSRVVTHLSTDDANTCLTSVIGREPVH